MLCVLCGVCVCVWFVCVVCMWCVCVCVVRLSGIIHIFSQKQLVNTLKTVY